MNLLRFIRKCLTDPPAAWKSAKLVSRLFYGKYYWKLYQDKALTHHLSGGGVILLEPGHSFTHCFYPGVEQYEPDVRLFLNSFLKEGYTFIDCGANVGYFSIIAGQLVGKEGKVVSVEANPNTYKLLEKNLETNGYGIPIQCALTNQSNKEVELFMPVEGGDVYSSLSTEGLLKGKKFQSFQVPAKRLDDIVQEQKLTRVDLVKIDIEGAEMDVLRSATEMLSKFRPVVITEYGTNTWPSFGSTPEQLIKMAQEYSYILKLFDVENKKLVDLGEDVWQSHYANIVLVPKEKVEDR